MLLLLDSLRAVVAQLLLLLAATRLALRPVDALHLLAVLACNDVAAVARVDADDTPPFLVRILLLLGDAQVADLSGLVFVLPPWLVDLAAFLAAAEELVLLAAGDVCALMKALLLAVKTDGRLGHFLAL